MVIRTVSEPQIAAEIKKLATVTLLTAENYPVYVVATTKMLDLHEANSIHLSEDVQYMFHMVEYWHDETHALYIDMSGEGK